METNLYRYIIRRSLKLQLFLIAMIFGLALLNPYMLSLTKRIINEAIGKGNFTALIWLCGSSSARSWPRAPSSTSGRTWKG